MNLNKEQQEILNGSRGPILAKYMKWLTDWGTVMGAERLIKVNNTHALLPVPNLLAEGASENTMNEYVNNLREALSQPTDKKCFCSVHATFVSRYSVPNVKENTPEQVEIQRELSAMASNSGFIPTFTCAPYLVGNVPIKGEICAWTESSAVVYANSIFGARTTRHGTESAIAASLLGWVPEFGVLINENRKGTLLIEVTANLDDPTDFGALGYFAGKKAGLGIPVFNGVKHLSQEDAKQLCAALASSGGVTMCHVVGITPEANDLEQAFQGNIPKDSVTFDQKALEATYKQLQTNTGDEVDMVSLGCPHASVRELSQFAFLLKGKKIAKDVRLYINTAHGTLENAGVMGFKKIIEDAGGVFITDTCPMNLNMKAKRIVTHGFKQAHYARGISNAEVIIDRIEGCVEAAITGKWNKNTYNGN